MEHHTVLVFTDWKKIQSYNTNYIMFSFLQFLFTLNINRQMHNMYHSTVYWLYSIKTCKEVHKKFFEFCFKGSMPNQPVSYWVYRHSMILGVSSHQPNGQDYLLNICFRQKAVRLQRSPTFFMGVHAAFSERMAMALFLLCVSCCL